MTRSLFLLPILLAPFASTLHAEETRYDGVVYLNEAHAKPLPLKTTRKVDLTEAPDSSKVLAHLNRGETVWILGFGGGRDYVEVRGDGRKTRGWVDEDGIEAVPEEVIEIENQVRTAHRQKKLIANHEIEVGMTPVQVETALGKPDERTEGRQGDEAEEHWLYRTYKSVPQRDSYTVDGVSYDRIYYRKELATGRTVTFRGGIVAEIKEEDKRSETSAPGSLVPSLPAY